MEPLLVGARHRQRLTDLALDLTQKSAGFRASLPTSIVASLANPVLATNCYYSNLIEGHDTRCVKSKVSRPYLNSILLKKLRYTARHRCDSQSRLLFTRASFPRHALYMVIVSLDDVFIFTKIWHI
jgi:hypothetical protein